ncbi:hypothetical protein OT109_13790 [Phycisphaeraceae bacterium D3-23]
MLAAAIVDPAPGKPQRDLLGQSVRLGRPARAVHREHTFELQVHFGKRRARVVFEDRFPARLGRGELPALKVEVAQQVRGLVADVGHKEQLVERLGLAELVVGARLAVVPATREHLAGLRVVEKLERATAFLGQVTQPFLDRSADRDIDRGLAQRRHHVPRRFGQVDQAAERLFPFAGIEVLVESVERVVNQFAVVASQQREAGLGVFAQDVVEGLGGLVEQLGFLNGGLSNNFDLRHFDGLEIKLILR